MLNKLLMLSLLLLFTATSYAEGGRHGGRGHKLAKELDLTPQQIEQVKAIREKFKPQLEEKRDAAKAAREDLKKSLQVAKKGNAYKTELTQKFKKVQELAQAQHAKMFEMALEIRELLTDEQIAKFKGMHDRRGGMHGPRGKMMDDDDQEDDED